MEDTSLIDPESIVQAVIACKLYNEPDGWEAICFIPFACPRKDWLEMHLTQQVHYLGR